MVFQWVLIVLLSYEIAALRTSTDKVPTITEVLKRLPWYASAVVIAALAAMLVDHIYFQWVVP